MKDFIQLKKDNILKIGIKNAYGKDTGEYLEFDLEDIDLPLRINECEYRHRKNIEWLQMQITIIDKKQDKKGKNILSWKEQEKMKLIKEFYIKEQEALDLFLGENGTSKLLNGRNPYLSMYDDISEMLEPIMPKLKVNADSIVNKIKSKYSNKKEENIIE